MKFSDLPPGKYDAKIKDWGIEAVDKLAGKLKAVIVFDIIVANTGEMVSAKWDGFFENKEGLPNKNTIKTLVLCGFQGDDPSQMVLDNSKTYEVTVEKNGEYSEIKWVNLPGMNGIKKVTTKTILKPSIRAALDEARRELGVVKKKPKNFAPGASDDDDLKF
jgi:hypothetical protein